MTYLYLALVCIFFTAQFAFNKLYQVNTDGSMMDSSRLMLLYSLTTLIFLLPGSISTFAISPGATGVAFFYSIAFFSCIFACIPALRLGQLSTVTAFTVTGAIVIPFFYGVFFLSEELTSQKLIGMVIICLSLVPSYISDSRKKTPETSNRFSDKFIYIILCILIFAGNGAVGVAIKLLSIKAPDETINNFLILTAIIRLLMLIPVFATITLLRRLPKKIKNFTEPYNAYIRKRSLKKLFIPAMFGCLYALSNMLGNLFSFKCAALMDSSFQFPVVNGAILLLTPILSLAVFREKITRETVAGMALALVGLCICII